MSLRIVWQDGGCNASVRRRKKMTFFTPESGEIRFANGFCLRGGMAAREIDSHLRYAGQEEAVFCLPGLAVTGGSIAPVCVVDGEGLRSVRLHVAAIAGRNNVPSERQRSFLFERLGLKDPCPDTRQSVRIRCPFGTLTLYSDPLTGQAGALVEYQRI